MRQLTTDHLEALRKAHEPPCISLYQPTHRHNPERRQDPIRFRNLTRGIEGSLRERYPERAVRTLTENFHALERDGPFWSHRTEGLAILSSPGTFELFELQRPVKELSIVANTFYTKPLVRILQSADRYQILCLSRREARLYEGNRDALDPVDLGDIESTLTEVLGETVTQPQVTVRSTPGGPVHYGIGQSDDEIDRDRDRFFRAIDRAILQNFSRPSGLPLMLAALTEYHAPFRAVSHNPFLMSEGIQINPDALSEEELRVLAWQKVEPFYLARLNSLKELYNAASSRNLASDDVERIATATVSGRVGTLLVEADRQIPGRVDDVTGEIVAGEMADPEVGDVLNDLAEAVLRMKGDVVVVPAERMPSSSGLAATFRF